MLDDKYDDQYVRFGGGVPSIIDSRNLGQMDFNTLFHEVTLELGEPNWGNNPLFTVSDEPGGTWRKIMIVDSERKFCTFRSTTTDSTYKPIKVQGMANPWRLDNAIQDASAFVMRHYLDILRRL